MDQINNKIEIMAPAGSYESLMAAIQGGADSIYFGAGQLNMRSKSSQNFTLNDIEEISQICKEHHVRSYLTLNSIIYDQELEEMKSVVNTAKECGITAIIASDFSVITYAHSVEMEVHISTQCNITNLEAVRFFSQFANVMVTARELTLNQVAEITKGIEREHIKGPSGDLASIEVFVHGALCMAISGKCYLSLDNYNYSANKGACLQLCRRPYKVTDLDGKSELVIDNEYIMSPKDLKTIDFIDKILEAGVKVLKIEGRGRSPEYVKTVTQCYKEASLAYMNNQFTEEAIKQWNKRLATVYNRGFWDGYYLGKKLGEWSNRYGSQATQRKVYIGKVTNYFTKINVAEIKIEADTLSTGDKIFIIGKSTGVYEDTVQEIRLNLIPVEKVEKGDTCSLPTTSLIHRNDKLYKIIEDTSILSQ